MNITIKKAELQDKREFLLLMDEFYHSPAVLHPIPNENMEKCFNDSLAGSPYITIYLFIDNDKLIGFSIVTTGYSSEAGGLSMWIEDIYIKSNYRGQGLGSRFIQMLEEENKGKIKRLRLEAEEDNLDAIRLYKKQGFQILPYLQMIKDI